MTWNIKTMIPGAPQIDAESWIPIDYNLARYWLKIMPTPAATRPSLTKMTTSCVIGQAMKAGKFKESDLVTVGNDAWPPATRFSVRSSSDVPRRACRCRFLS
ncbi:hypothetical protein LNP74_04940 [Klebsiella pneumoniae subsp. pneumoniae]|nr:hypothetical protein [Klebsiella pneumoniae subsp. pneumoniae]